MAKKKNIKCRLFQSYGPFYGFMMQLVCNLLDEGNAAFCEGEWTLARGHFSEGISVARYAQAEGLKVPVALLESLYVNRAAALHNMGEFELGVRDCDNALSVSKDSGRALYRKAVCLKELGKYKEAYECSTTCLLTSPQVNTFINIYFIYIYFFLHLNMCTLFEFVPVLFQQNGRVASTLSQLSKNPLEHTHDFTQACSACFTRIGPGVLDCEYKVDLGHFCKKDILLCRRKGANPWRRVRPRPTRNNFLGSYVLCKEVLEHQDCKYGEACTFAYCQEEIDVWTQERRGLLTRELLFNPLSTNQRQALSVLRLLNSHKGMFMFLCEECFDYKPRIISKRYKESPSLCSNGVSHHQFDKNKCLVHVVKNSSICYNKIRPLSYHCQFDVCPRRHSCPLENSCSLAHSVIELECWILQKDRGTTHEEIVQESKKHWHKQRMNGKLGAVQSSGMVAVGTGNVLAVKDLRLMMKFVCSQCWKDGLMSEPDKTQKYCSSKARHSWTKERKVLLVKSQDREKWVSIRPLPFAKTYPQQYDICVHVLKQKKCHYIGNCSFAHSHEERELWTYMKNTGLRDLQHVYDVWLSTANQNKRIEGTPLSQSVEEKQITMPTDFAEPIDGFHCRLCGKHSNSERQWQQHISSERHKDRVLSGAGEEENLTWIHRFPGHCFALCPRLQTGCDEGVSCDFAHSDEELQEWRDRRDFLRRRLDKARADMLIAPTDNDFGKYNFLLQD
uniref:C3H1-type domain-containing protein n=1 Tax=Pygocentrus nattereri TaxID=42514 RepID=A0AAR2L1B5_PYGNA